MESSPLKHKIIALLQRAHVVQDAFLTSLPEQERTQPGRLDRWSAKELLVHITSWKQHLAESLARLAAGEPFPVVEGHELDQRNAAIFASSDGRAWPEVLGEAERSHGELLRQVEALPDDLLQLPQRFVDGRDRPVWRVIVNSAIWHTHNHIAEFYLQRGDILRATETAETLTGSLLELDDHPKWQSIPRYNLACFYAKQGDAQAALGQLSQAISLNPRLAEHARADADLAALRDSPEYQRLVGLSTNIEER